MSASHHHAHATQPTAAKPMRSPTKLMAWCAGILGAMFLSFYGLSAFLRSANPHSVSLPDEKAAAAQLLAKRLSGPGYFEVPPGGLRDESGVAATSAVEPHITASAAQKQVERIARERQLDAAGVVKVEDLIRRLTETPSSRVIGEEHLNVLRLNLALDELK